MNVTVIWEIGCVVCMRLFTVADPRGGRPWCVPPLQPKMFLISCSFWENLTKSYVTAPPPRFIWCDCDISVPLMHLCVRHNTWNWFQTRWMQLRSAIPIHIHSKSHSHPIGPYEQNTLNRTGNIFENAVSHRTVWTSLKWSRHATLLMTQLSTEDLVSGHVSFWGIINLNSKQVRVTIVSEARPE